MEIPPNLRHSVSARSFRFTSFAFQHRSHLESRCPWIFNLPLAAKLLGLFLKASLRHSLWQQPSSQPLLWRLPKENPERGLLFALCHTLRVTRWKHSDICLLRNKFWEGRERAACPGPCWWHEGISLKQGTSRTPVLTSSSSGTQVWKEAGSPPPHPRAAGPALLLTALHPDGNVARLVTQTDHSRPVCTMRLYDSRRLDWSQEWRGWRELWIISPSEPNPYLPLRIVSHLYYHCCHIHGPALQETHSAPLRLDLLRRDLRGSEYRKHCVFLLPLAGWWHWSTLLKGTSCIS